MNDQGSLELKQEGKLKSVEEYKFEPIKGYPMLNWKGKRPFESTQFYPAQLKETYGEEVNDWTNKIFWGDNLQVMSHLLKEFRGKVDLVYIDPPFDSKADYKKKVKLKGKKTENDHSAFEDKQYTDIWTNDDYLQFMYERVTLIRELLSDKGSLFLHCDPRKSHLLRSILDEVFGQKSFTNEIIWCYSQGAKSRSKFGQKHDVILFYSKRADGHIFNSKDIKIEMKSGKESFGGRLETDEDGREYRLVYGTKNKDGTTKYYKYYLDEGKIPEDYWTDINSLQSGVNERQGYPTQKPEALLERIVKASSNKDSIIFDCFMGSGTTQAVAMKLGRKFIGADINLGAIETTTKRLLNIQKELNSGTIELDFENDEEQEEKTFYTGFEVYNVNNYDVFRNPVEAKEILIQALEIQPLPTNTIYDGEKDGRMVKIMPVNRIANKADLNDLISGFNQKDFQKKFDEAPNKPVEHLLLICLGHEPDLAASLQKEMNPFKIDVEVVDILRDKSNLEFKRDSEASIKIEGDTLVIEEFYPMNLLQKLSIMKENVEDWKELTESVKIDFNYDGSVLEPTVIDVPEKDELVKGVYPIPEGAGAIRVKITDLLSESLEITLEK